MFAVFKSGGKQHRVSDGSLVDIELMNSAKTGDIIDISEVLWAQLPNGDNMFGKELCAGKVTLKIKVLDIFKNDKKIVFYKQRRQNHRRKKGHRQNLMRVEIDLKEAI